MAITILAVVIAFASIYARRTRLEKTTEFWGPETILAIQLSPQVTLRLDPVPAPIALDEQPAVGVELAPAADRAATASNDPSPPVLPDSGQGEGVLRPGLDSKMIDLTGTPGLGHLRHALLDERHYEWGSRTAASVQSLRGESTQFAMLTFSDPREHFPSATLHLELTEGWVGPPETADRVQLTARARPAVRHFLNLISTAQQAHYDNR